MKKVSNFTKFLIEEKEECLNKLLLRKSIRSDDVDDPQKLLNYIDLGSREVISRIKKDIILSIQNGGVGYTPMVSPVEYTNVTFFDLSNQDILEYCPNVEISFDDLEYYLSFVGIERKNVVLAVYYNEKGKKEEKICDLEIVNDWFKNNGFGYSYYSSDALGLDDYGNPIDHNIEDFDFSSRCDYLLIMYPKSLINEGNK